MTGITSIPVKAGMGLRHQHYKDILETKPDVPWFEVHSENYFADGGLPHYYLEQIAADYPLSFHGVGMSIGSAEPLSQSHLKKLKSLIEKYEPAFVSEHLSFSVVGNRHFNDLLPIPYTEASLQNFCEKVNQMQDFLGRQILIENPSSYIGFAESEIPEWEFFAAIPRHTGCGLIVDVNNIYVSAENHGYDCEKYLKSIRPKDVQEYHLAGHTRKKLPEGDLLIDDHGSCVKNPVWELFEVALQHLGVRPTLIEWDTEIPALPILLAEVEKAQTKLDEVTLC